MALQRVDFPEFSVPEEILKSQEEFQEKMKNIFSEDLMKSNSCWEKQGDNYIIKVDLPGYDISEVSVKLEDKTLVIGASHESKENGHAVKKECTRTVPLPDGTDTKTIQAEMPTEGNLRITVKSDGSNQPKKIERPTTLKGISENGIYSNLPSVKVTPNRK
ncbi:unnamed protein product [Dimorphilus gyrociliatus]|uniref:SHSP domain-containing protein n=1 Tax=Dimorphilus gyrociliatus TaxID=2664684 RepID=A0A7I8VYE5_9ANNE|nr:unnamed protein product [Dimorphilus gyrociliatus]